MSNKFKVEYYHKIPQTTSPYLQLLEAKKKAFGYKYEIIRNDRNGSQLHNKSASQTQYAQPSHKHSKTHSHEKEKRSQKQNSKKKRSHTEQGEDRLHQSLFLNREHEKQPTHQATKSLFTADPLEPHPYPHSHSHPHPHDQSINPQDFMRNCRNLMSQEEKALRSQTHQVDGKSLGRERGGSATLERLEINEIDDLINLIDTCVEESNDYINYLTEKLEGMRSDMEAIRDEQARLIKMKDGIINEKEVEIDRLRKELYSHQHGKPDQTKNFEIKKLLEIIDKITEENSALKVRLEEVAQGGRFHKEGFEKEKKDIYNQIHNKIDILNISIDKKNQDAEQDFLKDSKKGKFKPKFYK